MAKRNFESLKILQFIVSFLFQNHRGKTTEGGAEAEAETVAFRKEVWDEVDGKGKLLITAGELNW